MKSTPYPKRAKNDQSAVIVYSYIDRLVIERRAWHDPRKPGEKVRIVEQITLSEYETDDLIAMLPQAILGRERGKKARKSKNETCFTGDI